MKKIALTVLTLVAAVLFSFPSVALSAPKYGGTLVYGVAADLNNVDPHRGVTKVMGQALSLVCDNMVISERDGAPGPGLAESWELSDGGKVWIFHLRKNVKWHNGRDFVANDIKWNFERMLDPKTGSPWRGRFAIIESIQVVDPHTIKFLLKRPSIGFPATMYSAASAQVPMVAPESVNADGKIMHPIGTGPFEFVEWKPKEHFKVKKNKNYWVKGLPYLDGIIMKIIPDETIRLAALQSGELDVIDNLSIFQVEQMAKKPPKGITLNLDILSSTTFVHFNCGKPPFNDPRVRQAVAYGINKKDISETVYGEKGRPQNQPMMPASPWSLDVPDIVRDVKKAKMLLKEAGYPNGLDVTLSTATDYWQYMIAVQVVQEQLKEVGINIIIDASDWPTLVGKSLKGAFIMGLAGWPMDYDPVFTYAPCFTPKGPYSFLTGRAYDNPQLTELLQQADAAVDITERKNVFSRAVEVIVNDAPWIYLGTGPAPMGYGSYVKGLKPHISALFICPKSGLQYTWLDK
ncbi:MAG: ABC transporter substrate-binding protein [Desulfobacteraceae bacterium]|nr:ABC transporter substrate-binding protein [Desulfobacteraceae bacterium]